MRDIPSLFRPEIADFGLHFRLDFLSYWHRDSEKPCQGYSLSRKFRQLFSKYPGTVFALTIFIGNSCDRFSSVDVPGIQLRSDNLQSGQQSLQLAITHAKRAIYQEHLAHDTSCALREFTSREFDEHMDAIADAAGDMNDLLVDSKAKANRTRAASRAVKGRHC